jgi:transposase
MLKHGNAESLCAAQLAGAHPSTYVPIEVVDVNPVNETSRPPTPAASPAPTRREDLQTAQRQPLPSRLLAELPNGVSLELQCMAQDPCVRLHELFGINSGHI